MDRELVMYSRVRSCPYVRAAKRVLDREQIPYREIFIDEDTEMEQRVVEWTGYKSVPTIIVARLGEDMPYADPEPLEPGKSPKGIDRGSMITEPGESKLEEWLTRHGFMR